MGKKGKKKGATGPKQVQNPRVQILLDVEVP